MKQTQNNKILKTSVFALVFFLLGAATHNYVPRASSFDKKASELSLFWEVWDLMEEKYVDDDPKREERIYGAIAGLVDSYNDDYSTFLKPEKSNYFNQTIKGSFGGIGAEITVEDGLLLVVAPLKNSPAEEAGVKAGDVIKAIDGEDLTGHSFNEAVSMIRGKKGTDVTLSISRIVDDALQSLDVVVTRDIVTIPVLETDRQKGVFIIHLYNFNQASEDAFKEALREFKQSETNKLIIDLRNNPGGYLEAAVDISSYFIDQGKIIVTEDFGNKDSEERVYRSAGYADIKNHDVEIAVIINEGSASASEILAGALQEYKRAVVIGTTSFGKGSVQELISLPQDTSLKVTIAQWLTPKGKQISKQGIVPDIEVFFDDTTSHDEQLDAAINYLKDN